MKKLFVAIPLTLLAFPAFANDFFFKPYVGADYQYTRFDYQSIPELGINGDDLAEKNLHGGNVHVGARVHKNLGVEASYSYSKSATKHDVLSTGINTKVKVSGATLDLLGYLPVAEKVELIGTGGISYLRSTIKYTGAFSGEDKENEFGGRVGAGAQYWLTDQMNVRGIVRYQSADLDDTMDHAIVTTVGLNYQF